MLSAGKSTLMEVLAVWASRRGLGVTLVLGDVMGCLDRLDLFTRLGLAAAPILGSSNRARHLRQFRRVQATRRASATGEVGDGQLARVGLRHVGYHTLAIACPLDAMASDERPQPFALGREPCRTLRRLPPPMARDEEADDANDLDDGETEADDPRPVQDEVQDEPVGCPLYMGCPRRQVERDLVEARIWLATPASLVYTSVPSELNAERLRMAELVCRRSDLVIVDEADAVQVQLDNMFCPTQPLTGGRDGGDAWLDALNSHLATVRPRQTPDGAQRGPAEWSHALHAAMIATEQIYSLLQDPQSSAYLTRDWVSYEYFSEWSLLQRRLARALSGLASPMGNDATEDADSAATKDQQASLRRFTELFDAFTDDHLGDLADPFSPDPNTLAAVARVLLANNNTEQQYRAIEAWIEAQGAHNRSDPADRQAIVTRLRFALLVALLSKQLTYLTGAWRQVEGALLLDRATLGPLQRPPADFTAVLPDAPMGNILGYQFLPGRDGGPGSLRFVRCQGVGRAMLRLSDLFALDGLAGPNTLLLSGTSWAGASPSYHVLAPIVGVLDMPEAEREALRQSVFTFQPYLRRDDPSRSIAVSGLYGGERDRALGELLEWLVTPDPLSGVGALERERDRLPVGRQRVLLVVGSYHEACEAYRRLIALRPEWDANVISHGRRARGAVVASDAPQVAYLTPDDDPTEDDDATPASLVAPRARRRAGALPRGQVARLSETNAWILIAPLKAIERGHNILNDQDQAALGAVYFLVRPHERPDDISFAIHTMNRFALEALASAEHDVAEIGRATPSWERDDLAAAGATFSQEAYRRWHRLLRRQLIYTTAQPHEREALVWNQLVPIWQVIGRLVRGGSPARVYFCDARFAPNRANNAEQRDTAATSLLVAMRGALYPYLADPQGDQNDATTPASEFVCLTTGLPSRPPGAMPPDERALARALYEPLYTALCAVKGL